MLLLLQLLLQASRLFLEADCTPSHLTCCRQAALVALQLRAVELQLSRDCLLKQQQRQQQRGRLLVSQLLKQRAEALQGVLHPFKDAEASLAESTDLPLLLPPISSADADAAAVPSLQQEIEAIKTASAAQREEAMEQQSSWFNSLLFSLEGAGLRWFNAGADSGNAGGCVSVCPPAAAAAANSAVTAAAAAADAVREAEEAAAAAVGLEGPSLRFLHLSVSQVLLFMELHPDAFVSGIVAQVNREMEQETQKTMHFYRSRIAQRDRSKERQQIHREKEP